ncbi:MAG: hypothetical protein JW821_02935 [Deltaproteobacteria bacterium]|nr:hypothetical protein [Deltaproteobacteria bacterium]
MLLTPSTIALVLSSIMAGAVALVATLNAVRILTRWNRDRGSGDQILLESRTYLVSTSFAFAMVLQILSLSLFVGMAQRAHVLFDGAMCAAGTLNVNPFGFPALILKLVNAILCGVWLSVNHADNRSIDQPLLKFKYAWVPVITALILAEGWLQFRYFLGMDPDIITSCCGTIFSEDAGSAGGDLAHLPFVPMRIVFYFLAFVALAAGARFVKTGKGALFFSLASAAFLPVSIVSIISFISPAIYELPTHHCPFCFLQREYFFVGYPMYISLLGASAAGISLGILQPFAKTGPSGQVIRKVQSRLGAAAFAGFAAFILISSYFVLFTGLVM